MKSFLLSIIFIGGVIFGAQAQEFHMPQSSPTVTVNQGFSTSFIKLKYSRPSVKGRDIFGSLIPFGKVWRTGANASAKITFGEEVHIGEKALAAGTYSLYTIPGEENWVVIFNKELKNWGAAGYEKSKDALRVAVPVQHIDRTQETFRISIENITKNAANLVFVWDNTRVSVPFQSFNKEEILAYLKTALQGENPPYGDAAQYYYAINYKIYKALGYIKLAIKKNPEAYYLYSDKAQILEKLGRHKEAVKAAKKAADMAKKHPAFYYEYQKKYEDLKSRD